MNPIDIKEFSSFESWNFFKDNISEFHLVDVRTEEEWKNTGVPDLSSIGKKVDFITFSLFDQDVFIKELNKQVTNKNAAVFFICAAGGRSAKTAELAAKNGYTNVYNINDGFVGNMFNEDYQPLNVNGWKNVNLPWRAL